MRNFVLMALGATGFVVVGSMSAQAGGIGGSARAGGFAAGPLGFRGGPAIATGRAAPFTDLGIAGRGLGTVPASPAYGIGSHRPGGPGRGRAGGHGGQPDFGGTGYGGFGYGGYVVGDYAGAGWGYGGGPGSATAPRAREPGLPAYAGIREAPTASPAIYVIDRKAGRPATGSRAGATTASKGQRPGVRTADAGAGPLVVTVP